MLRELRGAAWGLLRFYAAAALALLLLTLPRILAGEVIDPLPLAMVVVPPVVVFGWDIVSGYREGATPGEPEPSPAE